jgi:hypothetical protein
LEAAMLSTVLIIILALLVISSFPRWPHSRSWGYAPSGAVALVLALVVILKLTGVI